MSTLTQLGHLSLDTFMRDYWQKQPVLIRNALPGWQPPIDANDLAGLAMEQEVESRLVMEVEDGKPWQLRSGPFTEEDFNNLPAGGWTLLVQAVDQWVPEVTALLDQFRFLPNWRLDDIMVSYAPDGASVGPHYDHYDVFLIQGAGRRRWHIGGHCDAGTERLLGTPLNILADFSPNETFELEPGDILYVPPGVAHWGIALDEAMTYSVGFRAPSAAEVIDDFAAEVSSRLSEDLRFKDRAVATQTPGLIDAATVDQLADILREQLLQPEKIGQWFGRFMTERKYDLDQGTETQRPDDETLADAEDLLAEHEGPLFQAPDSRFAYTEGRLFINGEQFSCTTEFAAALANHRAIADWQALCNVDQQRELLVHLLARDWLWLQDPCEPLEE